MQDLGDGFNLDTIDANNDNLNALENDFVKMEVRFHDKVMLHDEYKIRFVYNDQNLQGLTPLSTVANGCLFTPEDGPATENKYRLRIWTVNGDQPRYGWSAKTTLNGLKGTYIVPGESYKLSDFMDPSDRRRTMYFWIEGIRPSTSSAGDEITVELDVDGDNQWGNAYKDTVKVTVISFVFLNQNLQIASFLRIGHWGSDAGLGLDGYDGANVVRNDINGTFIDNDPDRFFIEMNNPAMNQNSAAVESYNVQLATLDENGWVALAGWYWHCQCVPR